MLLGGCRYQHGGLPPGRGAGVRLGAYARGTYLCLQLWVVAAAAALLYVGTFFSILEELGTRSLG